MPISRRDELLVAAAAAELGEDAGLGAVTKLAATYTAAPELLKALQDLVDEFLAGGGNWHPQEAAALKQARAAIAKTV